MADQDHLAILKNAFEAKDIQIWNSWRDKNPNIEPDLSFAILNNRSLNGANLRDVNLRGARLIDTRLRGADLFTATLYEANLRNADLRGANLSAAILFHANLRSSLLIDANLSAANLSFLDLSAANLSAANFENSICAFTTFANVDLSQAINLEKIEHKGPSTIGIDTLYKSGGKISEVFLRGCGVPDTMITYAPSHVATAIDFYSCFISYNHEDKAFARRVHDTLQMRGIRCWLDEKQMLPGDDIYTEIDRGIRYWDKVLLCCSENSLKSWWVDNEIDKAFAKERQIMKDRSKKVLSLIPLDLDGYLFSSDYESGKKQQLLSRIAADFKGWKYDNDIFETQIEQIIRALQTAGGKEEPPEPKL